MESGRDTPTGVELKDGRVLVAGGGLKKQMLRSAEIYDPRTGTWRQAAPMHHARSAASGLALSNGGAIVCGGSWFGDVLDSCEVYHP
jgi:Flp pilus assembly secretin CpaC